MCGLTSTGGVECWGWNYYGQLGDGTYLGPQICGWGSETYPIGCSIAPVAVQGLGSGVSSISASDTDACALTSAGAVDCWGFNADGRLGDGTTTGPEKCGEFPVGCSTRPVPVSSLQGGVVAIGSSWEDNCAITGAGGIECWGENNYGQLGDGSTKISSTPVAVQLPEGVRATAIAGGAQHTCALTSTGGVLCWGYNGWGQLGNGTDSGPQNCTGDPCSTVPVAVQLPEGVTAIAIASGGYHTCVITSSGGVDCWGRNVEGELGDGTSTDSYTPVAVQLPEGVKATAITSRAWDTCVVTSVGGAECWGDNSSGQLGTGSESGPQSCNEDPCSTVPVAVSGLEGPVSELATSWDFTCAVTGTGNVQCWGYDNTGGLGDGNHTSSLTPASVIGLMWSLSVSVAGAGSGTVSSSPSEIACAGSCQGLFAPESTVLLRASPAPGSGFVGFTGAGCNGSGPTCQVTMSAAQSVQAKFALRPSASIGAPVGEGDYIVGEAVPTSFSCAEGASGPGLSSCVDSTGAGNGSGRLDTSTPGKHTYTVTATSEDGLIATASISYMVVPAMTATPPPETPSPTLSALKVSIRGGAVPVVRRRAEVGLSCSGGSAESACRGELSLTVSRSVVKRVGRRRRTIRETIVLARVSYELSSGQTKTFSMPLTHSGLKLLGRSSRALATQTAATLSNGSIARRTLAVRPERRR